LVGSSCAKLALTNNPKNKSRNNFIRISCLDRNI
jgi:hypothetical protein